MSQIRIKLEAPRPKSWRRKLFRVVLVLLLLLAALYFAATSATVWKKFILPQVSNALQTDITAGDLQISPFRQVVLREVKVQPRGGVPLLNLQELRARYSLMAILRGNLEVTEVTLESPSITIVENADGTSNLDALLKMTGSANRSGKPAEQSSAKPASIPRLNVQLVAINNATIRVTKKHLGGADDVVAVSGVNFKLQDLKNGQAGKIELALNLALDQAAQATAARSLKARLAGQFNFELTPDLQPAAVKGGLSFVVGNATGALADLAAVTARLECDTTATEIKQLALRFTKADVALGEVRVAGPLNLAQREGKLKLEVLSLDRRVLNLTGAARGIDFGTTTLNASSDIELLRSGGTVSVAGRLEAARLQLLQAGRTSPTLDLRCDYAATIDLPAQTAELRFLNLTGTQNARPFLQSELPQSLTIAWGEAAVPASEGPLRLAVSDFNLAAWREFLGDNSLAGQVSGKLQLAASKGGKQLRMELSGAVEKLSATAGSSRVDQADLRVIAHASVAALKDLKLDDFRFEVLHAGQSALVATASGDVQGGGKAADLQLSVQAELARWFAAVRLPGVDVSGGTLDFQTRVQQKATGRSLTGKLVLTDFGTPADALPVAHLGADLDFAIAATNHTVEIQKLAGLIRVGEKPGGRIEVGGKLDLAVGAPTGRVILKVSDLNQELLRPLVAPALGDQKLISVAIGSAVTVDLEANHDLKLSADLQVTNLIVHDPTKSSPEVPLQARVQVGASVEKQIAQLRLGRVTLTPTDRAKNELNLTGTLDLSKADAITGNLMLRSAALDFTRYYNLFTAKPAPGETRPAPAPAPATSRAPAREPDAVVLSLQNFTCDVEIGHVYLREMDVADWHAIAKVSGGQITLQPCKFTVNGAPMDMSLEADLGVPGYRYAVGLDAQGIPLDPLVNTFAPERAGQISGQFTANLDLKGAGVTEASLQANLTGQYRMLATNLNLSVNNVRSPILNTILNTIIGLPDLIAGLSGRRDATQMKWANDITAKPIDVVLVTGEAGGGKLEIKEAQVRSAAFQVQSAGEIVLASVLTNSTMQFPIHIALGRPYAAKIGWVSVNTPTHTAYVALPDFLTLKGTLGKVEKDLSTRGLLLLAGKAAGGLGKEFGLSTGDSAKAILGTVSGALLGKPATTSTNASDAATNAPSKKTDGLLNLFKKPKAE